MANRLGPILAGAPFVLEWQMAQRSKTSAPFLALPTAWAALAANDAASAMPMKLRNDMCFPLMTADHKPISSDGLLHRLVGRFGGLQRGAEGDRIGDVGHLHRIDAGAFDLDVAIAQQAAPDALLHPHALDIGQRDLVGGEREQAGLLDKAVRSDADL